jgi:hypothetical protein
MSVIVIIVPHMHAEHAYIMLAQEASRNDRPREAVLSDTERYPSGGGRLERHS